MELFYNEATKSCEEVDDCQSPDGLGPTENSYDLTSLIFDDGFGNEQEEVFTFNNNNSQNNEHSLIHELNPYSSSNNVGLSTPIYSSSQGSTMMTPTNLMNPTQLKLEESINLTSICQTSLIPGDENPLGFSLKEEPDSRPNPRRRKLSDDPDPVSGDMPEYRNKRDRNNVAVRKSREKSKEQQKDAKERVDSLRHENKILENKVVQLQAELKLCRSMFINAGAPVPQALEDALKEK